MSMDLTTYSGLQAAVADYLNRTDLTGQITGFISLAEAKIARKLRRTTVRNSQSVAVDNFVLPNDCAELRSIRLSTALPGSDVPIKIVTTEMLDEQRAFLGNAVGRPSMAAVYGNRVYLSRPPDAAYTVVLNYFQKLVPLSTSNPSNAVLAEAPDIYLYGSLAEAAPFLEHDERLPLWQELFQHAIDELMVVRDREEYGASLRPARLPVSF